MLKSKERQLKEIYLKDVDKIAIQMEEIWGPGVLQKLVSEDTANKFSKAKVKLNTAIVMGEKTKPDYFKKVCDNIIKGYLALDKEARLSGHEPPKGEYWLAKSKNDKEFKIVKNFAEADIIIKDKPQSIIYTLDELAEILETLHEVNECKKIFAQAKVTKFENEIPFDDEIPW
tara:strand:- start:1652 stop:2170 length:519 start_codon:yes stop_codon:yes gene_type:complete